MKRLLIFSVIKKIAVFTFAGALAGVFAVGNYLMIGGHRPYHEVEANGFVYPIPGKGGQIFVTVSDLALLIGLLAIVVASMVIANFAHRSWRSQS